MSPSPGTALPRSVDAERPPPRGLFGPAPIGILAPRYAERPQTWGGRQHVPRTAQG
ncbi:hypothetical protein ACWDGI_32885 [Streptomyces sp. NPDC001220]